MVLIASICLVANLETFVVLLSAGLMSQEGLIPARSSHKLAREAHQAASTTRSALALHVHLERHLSCLLHGRLLVATGIALGLLLI